MCSTYLKYMLRFSVTPSIHLCYLWIFARQPTYIPVVAQMNGSRDNENGERSEQRTASEAKAWVT